ncbi:MAG TPA: stage II sporulation protein R [Clostridiaceae bacterium]|nr:stage II sporulation protein R [Clostridiaceae bacterium]HBF77256.1 stage II sporulation protein R [Clostridiaceae bacterium]HBG38926.1 stage II sporulation protein R [Clostridiaceae bacterium]HBN29331.1 stage II sporulation protein R [Clostridiaceae bacterium]HBX48251.1 stage II sporulation protein R [Clostridiaceae bacterium]
MRKKIIFLICSIMIISILMYMNITKEKGDVASKIIRFHCVANSDSSDDQRVKLKVRDAVLNDMGNKLQDIKTREESLTIIENSLPEIESTANDILLKEGKNYKAKAYLGKFNFPVKNYSDITLPSGEYTALRIVLGDGNGKNWWCVMFPPLCFIDITRGLTDEETDMRLNEVLTKKETDSITTANSENKEGNAYKSELNKEIKNNNLSDAKNEDKNAANEKHTGKARLEPSVEFRFKTVDTIKNAYSKLKLLIGPKPSIKAF